MKNTIRNPALLTGGSRKSLVRLVIVSGAVSLALIVLLGATADWSELFSTLRWGWLASAALALTALQFMSGYRLHRLLPEEGAARQSLYLDSVQVMNGFQALIKLLPFRLGEAGFFWLAQRYLGLSFRQGFGVFLSFRIWDFRIVALSFFVFGGLFFSDKIPGGSTVFLVVGAGGALLFLVSSCRLILLGAAAFRQLHRLVAAQWVTRAADALCEAAASLGARKSVWRSVETGVQSLAVWLIYFFMFYSLYNCVGVPIGWTETIVVASGMILVGILPIQTIGGIGLVELGQASLLVLADLSPSLAASKSLAVGALFLVLSLSVPALLAGIFTLRGKRDAAPSQRGM